MFLLPPAPLPLAPLPLAPEPLAPLPLHRLACVGGLVIMKLHKLSHRGVVDRGAAAPRHCRHHRAQGHGPLARNQVERIQELHQLGAEKGGVVCVVV